MATRRQREAAAPPPPQAANTGAYIYTIIVQSGWSDSDLRPGRIARGLFVSLFRAIFESVRCYGLIRVHLGSIIDFVNSHCMSASLRCEMPRCECRPWINFSLNIFPGDEYHSFCPSCSNGRWQSQQDHAWQFQQDHGRFPKVLSQLSRCFVYFCWVLRCVHLHGNHMYPL